MPKTGPARLLLFGSEAPPKPPAARRRPRRRLAAEERHGADAQAVGGSTVARRSKPGAPPFAAAVSRGCHSGTDKAKGEKRPAESTEGGEDDGGSTRGSASGGDKTDQTLGAGGDAGGEWKRCSAGRQRENGCEELGELVVG